MGRTLLTAPTSVVVCLALFLVGGFGPGTRHVAGERTGARRGPGHAARARGRRRAAAGAALAPRPPLPVQHAERDRRVVPRGRRDRRARGRCLSAMLRTVLAGVRAPPGRSRTNWRCSTRCSSCTGCAIPTACASRAGCRSRCPTSRSRRCCYFRSPKTPSSTDPRPAMPARSCSPPGPRPTNGWSCRSKIRARIAAGGQAEAASKSSSAGWRSPMMVRRC